jgi:predicted membrane GTPase involved in stress response
MCYVQYDEMAFDSNDVLREGKRGIVIAHIDVTVSKPMTNINIIHGNGGQ